MRLGYNTAKRPDLKPFDILYGCTVLAVGFNA